ncbi:FBW12 protein, partial [Amia calva]|nr:FBW12 protein [Amia calva]
MQTGRAAADYTAKTLRGHTGRIVGLAYVLGNSSLSDSWKSMSVVCSASTDGTIRAWNVQEGVHLWTTSVQEPLGMIIADQQKGLLFSADSQGTIKAWKGLTGEELGSFPTSSSACSLLSHTVEDQSFLIVGSAGGSLYTLTSPALSQVSKVVAYNTFKINVLTASPDKQWVIVGTNENFDQFVKVFYAESLTCPCKDEPLVSQSLPVNGCSSACFLPSEAARVLMLHSDALSHHKKISVFDIKSKKSKYKVEIIAEQVGSFQLETGGWHPETLLRGCGSGTVLTASGHHLKVYTVNGTMLACFKDHTEPITAICADSFRVVTASQDLSLRVLTWQQLKDKGLSLDSRYHLLGGSHMFSRGFTNVACDYASIVASVAGKDGKDVLKAYVFNT